MAQIKRSEYIIVSRTICKTLFKGGYFGAGSIYFDNLAIPVSIIRTTPFKLEEFPRTNYLARLSDREFSRLNITKDKIEKILDALVKQQIIVKKKKEHGWKYYLNMERYDKIKEIIKETGSQSVIPILLMI